MLNQFLTTRIMPTCYQLIGVPGSGKSTFVQSQNWHLSCAVISTDNHVEQYAATVGKTYNEVFDSFMPTAVKSMTDDVIAARTVEKDIVWDQTSTTVKSRKRKFQMLPNYRHIAVVFETPDLTELHRRLNNRPGKNIPDHIVNQMISQFQDPTLEEGFSEIWRVKQQM